MVVLPGTKIRAGFGDSPCDKLYGTERYDFYSFGHGRGWGTNSAAGVSIGVSKALWVRPTEVQAPPSHLRGGGGSVRIKGARYDLKVIGAYFPPVQGGGGRRAWEDTVKQLFGWVTA